MIAPQTPKSELTADQQELLDKIWQREEQLLNQRSVQEQADVAADFVSFDTYGNAVVKADFCDEHSSAGKPSIRRLWGYFGSNDSCCLAYIRTDSQELEHVCLVLWIERDGEWQKTFHYENRKIS